MKTLKKTGILVACLLSSCMLAAQWTKLPSFTQENLRDVDFIDPATGVTVGEKGSVYKTNDGGRSWEFISPEKDFNYTSVELISPLDFYVSGFKNLTDGSGITQLFSTNDGGQTWQVINSYGEVGEPSQVRCERDNIWFLSGWRGLQKSTDKGKSWELVYKGGGTMVLTDLKTDLSNPESIFVFGTVGGFATYSTMFRHSLNGTPWELPSTFDFDNVSAYTAFDFQNDSIILFRNFYNRFMPNDTSNILSILYDFDRDDLLPGQNTGDTVWHFKIKTVNDRIPHYVNDCHFFSLTGLGYSIENAGGINRTNDGGKSWELAYSGAEPLNAICMMPDSSGFVVGDKGIIVKLDTHPTRIVDLPDNDLNVKIFPSPATDRINIEIVDPAKPAILVILDASGRAMMNREIHGTQTQIDISGWPRGIYYVSVRQEKKTTTKKVVRE
jgi:photosystem II stability/assembly factor-like uncharacterized protein